MDIENGSNNGKPVIIVKKEYMEEAKSILANFKALRQQHHFQANSTAPGHRNGWQKYRDIPSNEDFAEMDNMIANMALEDAPQTVDARPAGSKEAGVPRSRRNNQRLKRSSNITETPRQQMTHASYAKAASQNSNSSSQCSHTKAAPVQLEEASSDDDEDDVSTLTQEERDTMLLSVFRHLTEDKKVTKSIARKYNKAKAMQKTLEERLARVSRVEQHLHEICDALDDMSKCSESEWTMTSQSLARIAALGRSVDGDSLSLSGTDRSYSTISVSEKQNQVASYDKHGPPIDTILTQPQLQLEVDVPGIPDQQGWQSPPRKHTVPPSSTKKRESEATLSPSANTGDNYYSSLSPQRSILTSLGKIRSSPLRKKKKSVKPPEVNEVTMQDTGSPQPGSRDEDSEGDMRMGPVEEEESDDDLDLEDVGLTDDSL